MTNLRRAELTEGYVSWAGDEFDPVFAALWNPTVRWNGWLCPYLNRVETQRLVDYNASSDYEYVDQFAWDGDVLVMTLGSYPDEEPDRIEPIYIDGVPHWTPGGFSWTWCEMDQPLTQDECDAIGVDGRDGTGTYFEGNLTGQQRDRLKAFRTGELTL